MSQDGIIDILSGDGNSPETAIKFTPCHISKRAKAELAFMWGRFGIPGLNWTEERHYTSTEMQSVWVIKFKDGSERKVYFDTEGTIYDEK